MNLPITCFFAFITMLVILLGIAAAQAPVDAATVGASAPAVSQAHQRATSADASANALAK